jgi:hypothetical protein
VNGKNANSTAAVLSVVLLLITAGSGGCGSDRATLSNLNGIDELKARFNRDAGKPRIVLLLSPT